MQVFISWSGDRSKHVALSFQHWLRAVIQRLDPWVSPDTEKGATWDTTLSEKLETSEVGIICLTKDNLLAPYIHYEAGVLAKSKAHVCTFLYDLNNTDVKQPLARFQHTENNKEDIFRMVTTINGLGEKPGEKKLSNEALKDSFDTYWDRLSTDLAKTPKSDEPKGGHQRSKDDMLREVLTTVRGLQATVQDIQRSVRLSRMSRNFLSHGDQRDGIISGQGIGPRRPSIGAFEGPSAPEMADTPHGLNGPSASLPDETSAGFGPSGHNEHETRDFADGPTTEKKDF